MSNTSPMVKESKRLHRLGLAIHWLHSRSKRPIGNEWATGARKEWTELSRTYKPGLNVGVRLGEPSKLENGYLCVVDVDIKSESKEHRKEAIRALRELVGTAEMPEVRSGRGNGSRHLYCVTAEPFKTWNPAESEETIKVKMPSKSPSKRELKELTEKEIKNGWRLSKAWEISLYSDGRQVVLPPSIHPDTGKPYFWKTPLVEISQLPLIDFGAPADVDEKTGKRRERTQQEAVDDFAIDESLDIRWLPGLDRKTRGLIVSGIWNGVKVEDRSAYLLPATIGLVSAGLDKMGILTVLTDKSTYLGECAYDHAQTTSRKRAAKWLWNYTVKRVMEERDPKRVFEGRKVKKAKILGEAEAAAQAAEIEEESDWKQYLEKTEHGLIRSTFNNCKTILENSCDTKNIVGRDEFASNDFYLTNTPWRSKKGDAVTDIDITRIKAFCAETYRVEFGDDSINKSLIDIADRNRYHPVRTWVKSLEWDGISRAETWLMDLAGATGPDQYIRAISRKVLVALVKRIFEPGCKFDHVLILEGLQGTGKSTMLSNLTAPWFSDETLNIGDKDAVLTMQSKWLIELGELSTLSKSEVETVKAFISRRTDRIRAPYGKRVEEFPRQCIFIGSTNKDEYLRDESGNRRFWPIKCGTKIDFQKMTEVREQLFAEAYGLYLLGEPIYLDDAETELLARVEQELRGEVDEWLPTIRDLVFAEGFSVKSFEMRDVSKSMEVFGAQKLTPWDQKRIATCLRHLGFEKFQEPKGQRRKLWRETEKTRFLKIAEKEANGTAEEGFGTATNLRSGSTKTPMIADFY